MKLAAATIEDLNRQVVTGGTTAQNQAIFRLGQMDMKESIILKILMPTKFISDGIFRSTLLATADMISKMEVP
jgi:hypothetical protein